MANSGRPRARTQVLSLHSLVLPQVLVAAGCASDREPLAATEASLEAAGGSGGAPSKNACNATMTPQCVVACFAEIGPNDFTDAIATAKAE